MNIPNTSHKVYFQAAQNMKCLEDKSVNLVVTSPPYPMIEMWDGILSNQNQNIKTALDNNDGKLAFELMHQELDKVWRECYRVLNDGGFMCINIGDATRNINNNFELFNNHSRIISSCLNIGFVNLPNIIWRKKTNAPNKFMGSGMMPCGAYVTLEHEWILVFRKGSKRLYSKELEKNIRRESSYFWEERNVWFSDLWEIIGTKQTIFNSITRDRSAAFPMSIPYRLINMYSQRGDIVLDPFSGLGTTAIAAMISQRNSISFEIDSLLQNSIEQSFKAASIDGINKFLYNRYTNHLTFVEEREKAGKELKYQNNNISCKVMTKQEIDLTFNYINSIQKNLDSKFEYVCTYGKSVNNHFPNPNSLFK